MKTDRPQASVLLTGDELLDGRVADTNGRYLSASLVERGARVVAVTAVPDDAAIITAAVRSMLDDRVDVLVVSGGLGTTHDDLTMAAVAAATRRPLVESEEAMSYIRRSAADVARRRGWSFDEVLQAAAREALLPHGAACIRPAGMAPGALLQVDRSTVIVLPGVPRELEAMFPAVLDEVSADWPRPDFLRILRVYGVGEMAVSPLVDPMLGPDLDVAVTISDGEITLRVAGWGEAGSGHARDLVRRLQDGLPVYSSDGRTIDDLVAGALLRRADSVAVAESCTGGLLGGRLTDRPGSSEYFMGGIISYANEVKASMLHVPEGMLAEFGAVSEQVAAAMAEGVREVIGTTWGLGTTGVAGPGGGTPEKPVGLVYLGCSGPAGTLVREHHCYGDRLTIRRQSAIAALHLFWDALQAAEGPSVRRDG